MISAVALLYSTCAALKLLKVTGLEKLKIVTALDAVAVDDFLCEF